MVSSETARFNTMRQLTFLLSALQGLLPTWSEALLLCPEALQAGSLASDPQGLSREGGLLTPSCVPHSCALVLTPGLPCECIWTKILRSVQVKIQP
jgi:hypothetical protein